jgi:hypothetical protein
MSALRKALGLSLRKRKKKAAPSSYEGAAFSFFSVFDEEAAQLLTATWMPKLP